MKNSKIMASIVMAVCFLMIVFVVIRGQAKLDGYHITGIVQDAKGDPVAGAKVFAYAMNRPSPKFRFAVTDSSGRFRLENIREGTNVVSILLEGEKHPDLLSIAGVGNGSINVEIGETNPEPNVVIVAGEPNPSIYGSVVDKKTKKFDRDTQIKICLVRDPSMCSSPLNLDEGGNFSMAVPTEPFTFTVTSGAKAFKLKQKNADGQEDEVISMKSGEKKVVTISLE